MCVIGSGAAGLTIAAELVGSGVRTIVLEGGERQVVAHAQSPYRTDVVGLAHAGVHDLRFRALGGSTTRWAGQALPLFDVDFAERSWVPGSGWPFDRDELEPHYRRAAALMALPSFPRAFGAPGTWPTGLAGPPAFDPALVLPFFSAFMASPDFAAHLGPLIAGAADVEVLLGANVTELVTDPAGTAVETARARSFRGRVVVVEARAFVICCGGIDSARLLLVSDRHAEGGIGNAHDLVGRCFQDHLGFVAGPVAPGPGGGLRRTFEPSRVGGVRRVVRFAAGEALQRRERLLHASGSVVFDATQPPSLRAGKELYGALRRRRSDVDVVGALRQVGRDPLPLVRAAARHFLRGQAALDTSTVPVLGVGCEQVPNPASRVTLADDRDDLGVRRAVLDWRLTAQEVATCRRFAEVAAGELERTGLGEVDLAGFHLPDDPDELSGIVSDAGHHMGTTRMANRAEDGVVDADLRVHGVENLYVGSSAVFPTSGFSNPTFTILALALRLSDRLRAELGVGAR